MPRSGERPEEAADKDSYVTSISFEQLGLADAIQRALRAENYLEPTPIQAQAIPELLAGRDMLGIAQTGTGKTAAFALPILHRLSQQGARKGPRNPRALILSPTRELAIQIGEAFRIYGRHLPLRRTVVVGGVSQNRQVEALRGGVDILIATPGRLLDLMQQRCVSLKDIAFFVLDEADRMLDMGFVKDVRRIAAALPGARQSLLFSATMPTEIGRLAEELLKDPLRVEVAPQSTPAGHLDQKIYHVDTAGKRDLLVEILGDGALSRVIVFTRTKHRANRVAEHLGKCGIDAEAIHGNKSQGARQRALSRFRSGDARVLVATDIAARGIDVDGVSHVINYELPNESESYVHRIGRTARAGASGVALSFCDAAERGYLRDIERLIGCQLTVIGDAPAAAASDNSNSPDRASRGGRRKHGGGAAKATGGRGNGRPVAARPASGRPRRRRKAA
jgi:ATP-dependent RNA helicase RhlE